MGPSATTGTTSGDSMSIPITCPKCRMRLIASEATRGGSVTCPGCRTAIPVPKYPVAIPVAAEPVRPPLPSAPSGASTSREVSVWVWRGLGVGAFVVICVIFAFIGAALNPDEPGLAASRMARKVGAPLALLLIGAVELVLWLRKRRSPT
jgi:hypothetical protein